MLISNLRVGGETAACFPGETALTSHRAFIASKTGSRTRRLRRRPPPLLPPPRRVSKRLLPSVKK